MCWREPRMRSKSTGGRDASGLHRERK